MERPRTKVNPYEPVFASIIGELNQRHYLTLVMHHWRTAAREAAAGRERESLRVDNLELENCMLRDRYWDGDMELDDYIEDIIRYATSYGPRFYFKHRRVLFLDEEEMDLKLDHAGALRLVKAESD